MTACSWPEPELTSQHANLDIPEMNQSKVPARMAASFDLFGTRPAQNGTCLQLHMLTKGCQQHSVSRPASMSRWMQRSLLQALHPDPGTKFRTPCLAAACNPAKTADVIRLILNASIREYITQKMGYIQSTVLAVSLQLQRLCRGLPRATRSTSLCLQSDELSNLWGFWP